MSLEIYVYCWAGPEQVTRVTISSHLWVVTYTIISKSSRRDVQTPNDRLDTKRSSRHQNVWTISLGAEDSSISKSSNLSYTYRSTDLTFNSSIVSTCIYRYLSFSVLNVLQVFKISVQYPLYFHWGSSCTHNIYILPVCSFSSTTPPCLILSRYKNGTLSPKENGRGVSA